MEHAARLTPDALLEHEAFVLRLAQSLVHDEATARDVAQETWLSALEHPPRPGAVRAWLARVTRNHASNLRRGEGRRARREERAARGELDEGAPGSRERLELQHDVVRAVLALDEPARGVVIAVYYDGLSPSEVARRRRVPAGTVRSQLSRGLAALRGALDREHGGDRKAWSLALAGMLRREEALAASGGALAGLPWPLGAAALVAVGIVAAVAWRTLERSASSERRGGLVGGSAPQAQDIEVAAVAPLASEERERMPVAALTTSAPASSADPLVAELDDLLTRSRQVRSLVLERRTRVEPAVEREYAWLAAEPDAGLVRLVDSEVFEDRLDLPWLAGGGASWSFTERTHDARRRPQLRMEQQGLGAASYSLGKGFRAKGAVVDLGPLDFRALALDPEGVAAGLEATPRAAWEVAHRVLEVVEGSDPLLLQQALRELRLDDEVEPEEGHCYLVRSVAPGEHDVLAVFQVARLDREGCTLAWKLLESREVEVVHPLRTPSADGAALPAPPLDLLSLGEPALLDELARVRARAEALLLRDLSAERGSGADVRRARLVEPTSPFTELLEGGEGASELSFATGRHGRSGEPDVRLEDGAYTMSYNVRSLSWFLDLGDVPLEDVESFAAERRAEAWALLATAPYAHFGDRAQQDESLRTLASDAEQLGVTSRVAGAEGHTYLVRSIFPGWHDQLVAFRLERRDELGDQLAWRVLRSWPVARRR